MILDNVNPNDLFLIEKKGPPVLGIIECQVQGEGEFEGAFTVTNERLIMNVAMNGQFYYRGISYNEIEKIDYDGQTIVFKLNAGNAPMHNIRDVNIEMPVEHVE